MKLPDDVYEDGVLLTSPTVMLNVMYEGPPVVPPPPDVEIAESTYSLVAASLPSTGWSRFMIFCEFMSRGTLPHTIFVAVASNLLSAFVKLTML
jgi:hypothetical protein